MEPIGFVHTKGIEKEGEVSLIILRQDLIPALDGIQDFSHLWVLFWMHKISKDKRIMKVRPRGRSDMPLLGLFSTRTPHRPNPIGLTLVKLLKVEDHVLTVQGLDAFHNTPVLDLKPFDSWDTREEAEVPDWWLKMQKARKERKREK